ncbi:MAG: pantoate--beta-alanine ligase, partial [Candidatus Eiseniibacteriota bacterium]
LKLLQMVEPDTLYLGQKDAQQAALVAQMVRDFDLPVRVVVCATVRERDGLALSSRNVYLSPEDRARARGIVKALRAGRELARSGRRSAKTILARVKAVLQREARPDRVDYVALVDPKTFEPLATLEARGLLLAAARFGRTRLIDNVAIAAQGE